MATAYVTAPPSTAPDLAATLVEEGLAACVNQVDCTSVYRWNEEVVQDEEVVLFVKTTADRYDDLEARIEELHPYDVPCIERFDEADVFGPFADWIRESVPDGAADG